MYLHIGKNCVIKDNSVVGIFDIEKIEKTQEYQDLYNDLQANKNILDISSNKKNTFILTEDNKKIKGYISNIGTNTIRKRKI